MLFRSVVILKHFLSQSFWDWMMILFITYVIAFIFKTDHASFVGLILGVVYKKDVFSLHKSWYEYLFFQKNLFFIGMITGCEWFMGSMIGWGFLSLNLIENILWSLFLANILILKMGLSVIAQVHFSSTVLRSLSCVIFIPWFIILKAGLEKESTIAVFLLLGLFSCLLGLALCCGRLLLEWAFLPFEWTVENER